MERFPETPDVMLIDEVAVALKITAKQIRRWNSVAPFQFLDCRSWIGTQGTPERWCSDLSLAKSQP